MAEFNTFKVAVDKQYDKLAKHTLFVTDVTKDEIWDMYLKSFPEGSNPKYIERTEHDCNCCKQFLRATGSVVAIVGNKLVTIWDINIGGDYQVVADALSKLVKSRAIKNAFFSVEGRLGTDSNKQVTDAGGVIVWNHFHYKLPDKFIKIGSDIGPMLSQIKSSKDVFKRGLDELTVEALETVIELAEQNSIYRGEEFKASVKEFLKLKKRYDKVAEKYKDNNCWVESMENKSVARFRNTMIGNLVTDISDGVELDIAVKAYEKMAAPENYKRSSAIATKGMLEKAHKEWVGLGYEGAEERRYAVTEDLTINNVLFADRSAKKVMNVFEEMASEVAVNPKQFDKIEEVSVATFIDNILPKASSIELMFDSKHVNNLVSLIAPVNADAKNMLKWGNNFCWSYNGEVTDSLLRQQVAAKGGRVDGALRFSHTWNYDGKNQSLMDLHVFMPNSGNHKTEGQEIHNNYPRGRRVGWNHRNDPQSGGVQDVDFTSPPKKSIPVENITFPDVNKMPEGEYILKIHNWSLRPVTTSGFKAEVEFGGQLFQYEYPKALKHHEWVTVAKVTLKDGVFSIEHKLPHGSTPVEAWGINSQQFHKVSMVMNSPNHWDGEETGNKHLFFMIEGCNNEESTRGFYNEYLKGELTPYRKVFEMMSAKMKVAPADNQLSGLGFSSTKRDQVICKVNGSFARTIKINF